MGIGYSESNDFFNRERRFQRHQEYFYSNDALNFYMKWNDLDVHSRNPNFRKWIVDEFYAEKSDGPLKFNYNCCGIYKSDELQHFRNSPLYITV